MSKKIQIGFRVDKELLKQFDDALENFKKATGLKPKKLECFEVALKDYIEKLDRQAKLLQKENPE